MAKLKDFFASRVNKNMEFDSLENLLATLDAKCEDLDPEYVEEVLAWRSSIRHSPYWDVDLPTAGVILAHPEKYLTPDDASALRDKMTVADFARKYPDFANFWEFWCDHCADE